MIPVALRTQACAGHRLRRFYVGWAAGGGAWALSLPLVTFVAASLPPYTRHRTVQWVCSLVQTAALVLYALLFAGRANRAFREASTVGDGGANLDFGSSLPRPAAPRLPCGGGTGRRRAFGRHVSEGARARARERASESDERTGAEASDGCLSL